MTTPTRVAPAARWFDLSRHTCLGTALDEASHQYRTNRFLLETERGKVADELTYAEFRTQVEALAGGLAQRGIAAGDRVAILQANGPRWLISASAVLRLGGVLVPLDARLDAEGQARLLRHCQPSLLLADGPTWRKLAKLELDLRAVVTRPLGELVGEAAEDWAAVLADPGPAPEIALRSRDDVAAIVYSSGTSGQPKGCLLTHGNYLSQMEALGNLHPIAEDDVYLSILPTNHAIDFMCGFLIPLLCGGTVVHLRTLRPEWILGALRDQRVTHLSAVPALLEAIERSLRERLDAVDGVAAKGLEGLTRLNAWLTRRRPNHALSATLLRPVHQALGGRLKTIFAGGAPVPAATVRALYDLGFPVAIGYGLTEACAVISVNDLKPFRADTVGPPLAGTEVRLSGRDAEGRGEILVRGPQVFAGYLAAPSQQGDERMSGRGQSTSGSGLERGAGEASGVDPALTAETLTEDGWLQTGDLGVIDATGHVRLVGRKKDMIVTAGGKNVYPDEVEVAFHGLVCEEFAVLSAHRIWAASPGEGEQLVLALRAKPEEREALLAEVTRRNRRLPAYRRLGGVLFTSRAFPRTTSLKLKRIELARELGETSKTEMRMV